MFQQFAHDVLQMLEKSLLGERGLQQRVEEQGTKNLFSSSLISPGCTAEMCTLSYL